MKKIMFNDKYGLTKAVLEGRKTMTRRIIRNVIVTQELNEIYEDGDMGGADTRIIIDRFSSYKVGEVVAVAQSYESIHEEMMAGDYGDGIYDAFRWAIVDDKPGWSNKMFVRADLMPHQIRITGVRVERLQDISDEDCIREGIVRVQWMYFCEGLCERGAQLYFGRPRTAFAALIDKISGKGTFESNPWVFVYEFELVK